MISSLLRLGAQTLKHIQRLGVFSYEAKVKTGRLQSVIEHVAAPPQGVGSAWGEDLAPQRGLEPNQAKLCQALKQTHSAPFSASQLL